MTPLVDVMLVLLIVFMVTAPMLTTGLKMDLPQAKSAIKLKPKSPVVVSVRCTATSSTVQPPSTGPWARYAVCA